MQTLLNFFAWLGSHTAMGIAAYLSILGLQLWIWKKMSGKDNGQSLYEFDSLQNFT